MGKSLYIAEKPSVAREFARVLNVNGKSYDGYLESDNVIVTWCVGHLITMSYPDAYDPALKSWSLDTLPFIPQEFKYEVIDSVKKQFTIVSRLLNRSDVDTIYVCTDSGREGEYIYRLVDQMAGVSSEKKKKRVWIDSQTEEEILRGIREAKDLTAYDNLAASAYLRAKEDYLMGINFSRVLTLKYGTSISNFMKTKRTVISVGRVMTCVLGMVVRREREIRAFVKTPFYRVIAKTDIQGNSVEAQWRSVEGSAYFGTPALYKDNGFKKKEDAQKLIDRLLNTQPAAFNVSDIVRKKENKNAPLLYNLAELQNDCSRIFKLSPDQTLQVIQELYEKKLVTYPRTDARVLSTAVAKEISRNINGLKRFEPVAAFAEEAYNMGSWKTIAKSRYTNDKQITDHYAIIPTGQGLGAVKGISKTAYSVYILICKRFLSIFYPPAQYQKTSLTLEKDHECFFASFKVLLDEGYMKVSGRPSSKSKNDDGEEMQADVNLLEVLKKIKKGSVLPEIGYSIKEGETAPPKRYNSGSMILAMENAGQLIEDEELRAMIKSSGIGTSATRAEILKKLVTIKYLALNKKTQIITPTELGEIIFEVVDASMKSMLNPELTASWEKGLNYVAEGSITSEEYMQKLDQFVSLRTQAVKQQNNVYYMKERYEQVAKNYLGASANGTKKYSSTKSKRTNSVKS